jgi:hypothetical protein
MVEKKGLYNYGYMKENIKPVKLGEFGVSW